MTREPSAASRRREVAERVARGETPDVILGSARQYAEEGRASHVAWVEHLSGEPCGTCTPESLQHVGTLEEQQEWVRKYDIILLALSLVDETFTINLLDAIGRIGNEEEHKSRVKNARHALRYREEARRAA